MSELPKQKELVFARVGLIFGFTLFSIVAINAYIAGVSAFAIVALAAASAFCLWAAVFASDKIAMLFGQWLP